MFCGKCGTEVQDGAGFCPKCGNNLKVVETMQTSGSDTVKPKKKPAAWLFILIGLVAIVVVIALLWLGKNNSAMPLSDKYSVEITPQGKFDTSMMVYRCDQNGNWLEDYREMELSAVVSITEDVSEVNDGYKKLVATFMYNYSQRQNLANELEEQLGEKVLVNHSGWISVFDRYTGYSMDENFTVLELNSEIYNITTDFDWTHEDNTTTCVVTVTCPEDYDGAIFYIGPYPRAQKEAYNSLDLNARLYTIEELSFLGDKYTYFSYTDK